VVVGVSEESIENAIIQSLQVQINILKEKEKTKELIRKRLKSENIDYWQKIKQAEKSIANLENVKFSNYELFKSGKLTKEELLKKKTELDTQIENLALMVEEYKIVAESGSNENSGNESSNPLLGFLSNDEPLTALTRHLADELLAKVVIYDSNRFEIVWKFSGFLNEDAEVCNGG
jgi:hypothetical protein